MATETSNVKVVVRVRPWSQREKKASIVPVVSALSEKREVAVIKEVYGRATSKKHVYQFDEVFTNFSTQEEVFRTTLEPMIDDVLDGFESTVFAYGQTGTGKTYTMEGDTSSEEHQGVIPRAVRSIFERLEEANMKETSVRVTYLEIYNEELSDLLVDHTGAPLGNPKLMEPRMFKQASMRESPPLGNQRISRNSSFRERDDPPPMLSRKLSIVEDKKKNGRGVHCSGLNEVVVEDVDDVLRILEKAQDRRRVAETKMNKASSRSHCLFSIMVHTVNDDDDGGGVDGGVIEKIGRLHLCDLAGSECAKTSGNDSDVMDRERKNINQSLLTLGRVITSLQSNGKNNRIPYRDSKLTRILQEALGGRSKTCIIATVSPSILSVDETVSTLNYAQQANGIKNKNQVSTIKMSTSNYQMPSAATQMANQSANGKGLSEWNDLECKLSYMESQVEEAQGALGRKHAAMVAALNKVEGLEEDVARISDFARDADESLVNDKAERERFQNSALIHHNSLSSSRNDLAASSITGMQQAAGVFDGLASDTHTWSEALIGATVESGSTIDECLGAVSECFMELQDNATSSLITMLDERTVQDAALTEGSSKRAAVISELVTSLSEHVENGDVELEDWAHSTSKSIENSNEKLTEAGAETEKITLKVQGSLNQNLTSVETLIQHQRSDTTTLNNNLASQAEKQALHKASLEELHQHLFENTDVIKQEMEHVNSSLSSALASQESGRKNNELLEQIANAKELIENKNKEEEKNMKSRKLERNNEIDKISVGILTSCTNQEQGRKHQELIVGLESMNKLVDTTTNQQQASVIDNTEQRSEELSDISDGLTTCSEQQEEGRKNKHLSVGLKSMRELVEESANEQQACLIENTKSRTQELNKISDELNCSVQSQESGRRDKDITIGLNDIRSLVENTAQESQATSIRKTDERCEELKGISDDILKNCSEQEKGRRNVLLVNQLQCLKEIVQTNVNEQKEFVEKTSTKRMQELNKISDELICSVQSQESGRRDKEITIGLNDIRSLVENTAQESQATSNRKTNERCEELKGISDDILKNCSEQEKGRRNKDLNSGLNQIRSLIIKTSNDHQSFISTNATKRISNLSKISTDISTLSSNQENGRKNNNLNQIHQDMLSLVEITNNNLQSNLKSNTLSRRQELSDISDGLTTCSEQQEEGRRNKHLSVGLKSMRELVEESANEQQACLIENTKSRTQELNKISDELNCSVQSQESGRRDKEITIGLNDIRSLVENTAQESQKIQNFKTNQRNETLTNIIDGLNENCLLQENGRQNQSLCHNLSSMQLLVHQTCHDQNNKLTDQASKLEETLTEINQGNATVAHGKVLEILKTETYETTSDHLTDLLKQREALNDISNKLKSENGEEKTLQLLNGLTNCVDEGRASTLKQLETQQADLSAIAGKLSGTKTSDETSLVATLLATETLVLQKAKTHQAALDQQVAHVDAQTERCNAMLSNQKCMHETMVANVMAGVADLLANGMVALNKSLTENVEELTSQNDQLNKENRALYLEIESFKREAMSLKATALSQVRAWGTQNANIRTDVLSSRTKSESLSRETGAVGLDCSARLDALNNESKRWGTANEMNAEACEIEINASKQIYDQIDALKEKLNHQINALENESQEWGQSNYLVHENLLNLIKRNEIVKERNDELNESFEPRYEDSVTLVDEWIKSDNEVIKNIRQFTQETNQCRDTILDDENEFVQASEKFVATFIPQQEEALAHTASWLASNESVVTDIRHIVDDTNTTNALINKDKTDLVSSSEKFVATFIPQQEEALAHTASWLASDEAVIANVRKLTTDTANCSTNLETDKVELVSSSEKFVATFMPQQEEALAHTASWLASDEAVVADMRNVAKDTDNTSAAIASSRAEFVQSSEKFVATFIPQQEEALAHTASWLASDEAVVADMRNVAKETDNTSANLQEDNSQRVGFSDEFVATFIPQQEEALAHTASWLASDEAVVTDIRRIDSMTHDSNNRIEKTMNRFQDWSNKFEANFIPQQEEALAHTASWLASDEAVIADMRNVAKNTDICSARILDDKTESVNASEHFVATFIPQQEEALAHTASWLASDEAVVADIRHIVDDTNTTNALINKDKTDLVSSSEKFVATFIPQQEEALAHTASWLASDEAVVADMRKFATDTDKCKTNIETDKTNYVNGLKVFNSSFQPQNEVALSHVQSWKCTDEKTVSELQQEVLGIKKCQKNLENDYQFLIDSTKKCEMKFNLICEELIHNVKKWVDSDSTVCDELETIINELKDCSQHLLEKTNELGLFSENVQLNADMLIRHTVEEVENVKLLVEDSEEISKTLLLSANEGKHGIDVILANIAELRTKIKAAMQQQLDVVSIGIKPRELIRQEVKSTCLELGTGLEELSNFVIERCEASNRRMAAGLEVHREGWENAANAGCGGVTAARSGCKSIISLTSESCNTHVGQVYNAFKKHEKILSEITQKVSNETAIQTKTLEELAKGTGRLCSRSTQGRQEQSIPLLTPRTLAAHNMNEPSTPVSTSSPMSHHNSSMNNARPSSSIGVRNAMVTPIRTSSQPQLLQQSSSSSSATLKRGASFSVRQSPTSYRQGSENMAPPAPPPYESY